MHSILNRYKCSGFNNSSCNNSSSSSELISRNHLSVRKSTLTMFKLQLLKALVALLVLCLVVKPDEDSLIRNPFGSAYGKQFSPALVKFMLKVIECVKNTTVAKDPEILLIDYTWKKIAAGGKLEPGNLEKFKELMNQHDASLSSGEIRERTKEQQSIIDKCMATLDPKKSGL